MQDIKYGTLEMGGFAFDGVVDESIIDKTGVCKLSAANTDKATYKLFPELQEPFGPPYVRSKLTKDCLLPSASTESSQ